MRTIDQLRINGKKVLLRADFNVSMRASIIADDIRIQRAIPTIKKILGAGATQIIILSHLGRPNGKPIKDFSLKPVAIRLSELLDAPVKFMNDCVDIELPEDKIILLENTRFHREEVENDEHFAKKLANHADCFVNDAFGTAHREHASTIGIMKFLPSAIGLLVEKEMQHLNIDKMQHPIVSILGAAKIKDKITLLEHFFSHTDTVLLGGGLVFTFMKALGYGVGNSLVEKESLSEADALAERFGQRMAFPKDFVVAEKAQAGVETSIVDFHKIPPTKMGLDVGPKTIAHYLKKLEGAKTVVWNGPLGVAEIPEFSNATKQIAEFLTNNPQIVSIVGGGDTVSIIENMGLTDKFTHVSTGGGAALEVLGGETLPIFTALEENIKQFP